MIETIFRGGHVIDGTGKSRFRADVAVSKQKIIKIGDLSTESAANVIDATGLIVSPGFIDIHTHSDLTLISNPLAQSKIRQGVTTELVGNCGFGPAPILSGSDNSLLRAAVAYLDVDPAIKWEWESLSEYLMKMEQVKLSLNMGTLVGHIPIHTAVVGFGKDIATPLQIETMKDLLRESLSAGAFGFSTGLNYSPVSYASNDELLGFAEVVAETDTFFAWHMRNYGDDLMHSVLEVVEVAKKTGARTQISHLVSVGERNWGTVSKVLEVIDKANSQGAEINVDVYPYIAGNCPLSQFLPDWAQEGGDSAMKNRMKDRDAREKILREWIDPLIDWREVQVSSVLPGREALIGKTITEIAEKEGKSGDICAIDLLEDMGNAIGIIAFGRSESDVSAVFSHPAAFVGSDGQSLDPNGPTGSGSPHPRSYGCFPRLLHSYVGPNGISLERAIHISSGAVAKKMRITDRGEIAINKQADIILIDPLQVRDQATYNAPHQFPIGIPQVMVNGELTIADGEHLGVRKGHILRKQ